MVKLAGRGSRTKLVQADGVGWDSKVDKLHYSSYSKTWFQREILIVKNMQLCKS